MGAAARQIDLERSVTNFIAKPRNLLIGGKSVPAASGKTFETVNPATGEVLAHVAEGDREDINRAVKAARKAFEEGAWPAATPSERGKMIWKLAELVEKHLEEFAELESLDNGKPISIARVADVPLAADLFRYMAGWATKIEGNTIPISMPGAQFLAYTLRQPIGVVGQIIPWNFPLLMAAWKLGPALAAGCTVVLKPAEQTPLSALRLGELIHEAGFPDGVVNIVTGFGETAGAALAAHPNVDKVAFTGSTEVGKLILQAAAGNLKKVSLELGGKSPNVIFDDADLETAIPGAASAIFFNHGQCCCAGSRLYVGQKVYDQVVSGVVEQAKAIKVGPGLDPSTQMGPLVSSEQFDRVCGYLKSGLSQGAKAAVGGKPVGGKGYFVQPTVLVERQARHESGAGGNLRSGSHRDAVQGPERDYTGGQRHDLWTRRRRLDQGHRQGPSDGRATQSGHGLGQLLQRLRCGAPVRRLQAVRMGPRDGSRGARTVHRGQVGVHSAVTAIPDLHLRPGDVLLQAARFQGRCAAKRNLM